jgi:hypothetical protein
MSNITFSTCLYNFKSKFDISVYKQWMHNMLSNVNNYNLVVYTDEDGLPLFEPYLKPNIKIIVKPYSEFYTYQFKDSWIKNQERNLLLLNRIDWKVNMLWSEKIHFVNETIQQKYFVTEFYGWCDIGYFRGRDMDLDMNTLKFWPSLDTINELPKDKIQYACVNIKPEYLDFLYHIINNKNEFGLPVHPIPPEQVSLAGGFFILHVSRASWWHDTYYNKLKLYFDNNYLVKDDQIIIADCVFSNINSFALRTEPNSWFDPWFMFQRLLL